MIGNTEIICEEFIETLLEMPVNNPNIKYNLKSSINKLFTNNDFEETFGCSVADYIDRNFDLNEFIHQVTTMHGTWMDAQYKKDVIDPIKEKGYNGKFPTIKQLESQCKVARYVIAA